MSTGKSKGKGGKGKALKQHVCSFFQVGQCHKADNECRYKHVKVTDPEEIKKHAELRKKFPQSRSASPHQNKGTRVCQAMVQTGKCAYGSDCKFSHDVSRAAPAPKAKGKATASAGNAGNRGNASSRSKSARRRANIREKAAEAALATQKQK